MELFQLKVILHYVELEYFKFSKNMRNLNTVEHLEQNQILKVDTSLVLHYMTTFTWCG